MSVNHGQDDTSEQVICVAPDTNGLGVNGQLNCIYVNLLNLKSMLHQTLQESLNECFIRTLD